MFDPGQSSLQRYRHPSEAHGHPSEVLENEKRKIQINLDAYKEQEHIYNQQWEEDKYNLQVLRWHDNARVEWTLKILLLVNKLFGQDDFDWVSDFVYTYSGNGDGLGKDRNLDVSTSSVVDAGGNVVSSSSKESNPFQRVSRPGQLPFRSWDLQVNIWRMQRGQQFSLLTDVTDVGDDFRGTDFGGVRAQSRGRVITSFGRAFQRKIAKYYEHPRAPTNANDNDVEQHAKHDNDVDEHEKHVSVVTHANPTNGANELTRTSTGTGTINHDDINHDLYPLAGKLPTAWPPVWELKIADSSAHTDSKFKKNAPVHFGSLVYPYLLRSAVDSHSISVGANNDKLSVDEQSNTLRAMYFGVHFGAARDCAYVLENEHFGSQASQPEGSFPKKKLNWKIDYHANLSYHKKWYPKWQTTDKELSELLDVFHDHSRGNYIAIKEMHLERFVEMKRRFLDWFEKKYTEPSRSDSSIGYKSTYNPPRLILCGYQVIWCSFFRELSTEKRLSVLGIYSGPYIFTVDERMRDHWTNELVHMLRKPNYFWVGYGAYHALQFQWTLGIDIGYAAGMALGEGFEREEEWVDDSSDVDYSRINSNTGTPCSLPDKSGSSGYKSDSSGSSDRSSGFHLLPSVSVVADLLKSKRYKTLAKYLDGRKQNRIRENDRVRKVLVADGRGTVGVRMLKYMGGQIDHINTHLAARNSPISTRSGSVSAATPTGICEDQEVGSSSWLFELWGEGAKVTSEIEPEENETENDSQRKDAEQDDGSENIHKKNNDGKSAQQKRTDSYLKSYFAAIKSSPKSLISRLYDAVVLWPYDCVNAKLYEFYSVGLPIFLHSDIWRMTRRGSHALAYWPNAVVEKKANWKGWDFLRESQTREGSRKGRRAAQTRSVFRSVFDFSTFDWTDPWRVGGQGRRSISKGKGDSVSGGIRRNSKGDGTVGDGASRAASKAPYPAATKAAKERRNSHKHRLCFAASDLEGGIYSFDHNLVTTDASEEWRAALANGEERELIEYREEAKMIEEITKMVEEAIRQGNENGGSNDSHVKENSDAVLTSAAITQEKQLRAVERREAVQIGSAVVDGVNSMRIQLDHPRKGFISILPPPSCAFLDCGPIEIDCTDQENDYEKERTEHDDTGGADVLTETDSDDTDSDTDSAGNPVAAQLHPFSTLPFSPYETDGRFELEPWGSLWWSHLTEFALRPYLHYFDSMADLVWRFRGGGDSGSYSGTDAGSYSGTDSGRRAGNVSNESSGHNDDMVRMQYLAETSHKMRMWQAEKAEIATKYWKNIVTLLVDQQEVIVDEQEAHHVQHERGRAEKRSGNTDPNAIPDTGGVESVDDAVLKTVPTINDTILVSQSHTGKQSRLQYVLNEWYGRRDLWPGYSGSGIKETSGIKQTSGIKRPANTTVTTADTTAASTEDEEQETQRQLRKRRLRKRQSDNRETLRRHRESRMKGRESNMKGRGNNKL